MTTDATDDKVLSYASRVLPPRWARWLLNPIGWPYFSFLTVACLWVLWESRIPDPTPATIISIIFVAPFFGILLLLRLVLRLVLWRIYRRPWHAFLAGFWRFGIPVGVGAVMWFLLYLHTPQSLAWLISEPMLRRHAQSLIAAEAARVPPAAAPTRLPPQWIGLYRMDDITYFPDVHGVRYFVSGSGFLDRQGFAFLPAGPPPPAIGSAAVVAAHYAPLQGDWYRVVEVW